MNLYVSTYLLASISLALFAVFALFTDKCERAAKAFLRSKKAAVVLFGGSGLWFLLQLSQLGDADFGQIKFLLIAVFGAAGVLAFFHLPDFLSVRGACVLALLLGRQFLDSAFMQPPESRLVLVVQTYIWVVVALYLGALPYRLRDFFDFVYEKKLRAKILGWLLFVCAASLVAASMFY